jgi:lambda family phage portal protein
MRRWVPQQDSADSALLPEQPLIRARTRDLVRNHGIAEGAIQTLVDNIIGSGLRLKSRPARKALGWSEEQAEEWSNQVEMLWCTWADSAWCDVGRSLDFAGLTIQAFRSSLVNGEALALPLWMPNRRGAPAATCIQMVEPDRLSNPGGRGDTRTLRGGIEIDEYGGPIAYWIRRNHPGDPFLWSTSGPHEFGAPPGGFDWERVEAYTPWGRRRVIHVHDKERVGQSRGKSAFASVLRQFKVLGDYTNAELKSAVVNAMVAIVTKSSLSQENLVELLSSNPDALDAYQKGLAERKRASVDFNAGMILPLGLGEDFASFTPGRPSTAFDPFVHSLFKHIAAGLNMPVELLLKDFSRTNYSSARAALIEAWRFFRGRRKWLARSWTQPIFELWLEEMVAAGKIIAPGYFETPHFYTRAKWIGDGRGWVDPLKEAQAAELRMRIGITTLEDECAEQGGDWEENIEQRSREERRAREAGVSLQWMHGDGEGYADTATDAELDPETGQEKPQTSGKRAARAARAGARASGGPDVHIHLPETFAVEAAIDHRLALAGTEQLVAGMDSLGRKITVDGARAAEASARVATALNRSGYRVPVRKGGKVIGTRPASDEEIDALHAGHGGRDAAD